MTDERLAEIEKFISQQDWQPEEDVMYDLLVALRAERHKFIELGKLSKSQSELIQIMMQQKNELNNGLEAERAKVADLESTNQWMHGLIKTYQAEKAELQKELETYRWIEKHRKENEHCSYCCGTGLKQIEVIDEPGQPPTDG